MGNRKEQIENLENEINQKQQTLRELQHEESKINPKDLTPEEIADIVDNMI